MDTTYLYLAHFLEIGGPITRTIWSYKPKSLALASSPAAIWPQNVYLGTDRRD